jgi:hypothetical protein
MNIARQYVTAMLSLAFFFIIDFFITRNIISIAGFDAEANPIDHWLLTVFQTVWVLLAWKIFTLWALFGAVILVYYRSNRRTRDFVVYALWGLVGITIIVDLWSIHVMNVVS